MGKRASFSLFAIVSVLIFAQAGCAKGGKQTMEGLTIERVLQVHSDSLMAFAGVVGTAIGEHAGKPCIKVYVHKKSTLVDSAIPRLLEGYPVVIEEVGQIHAQDKK
jgi:hypothetical protein